MTTIQVSPGIAPLQAQAPWQSGRYYFAPNVVATSASAALGNGTLRVVAFYLPNNITLSRIGAEVTVIGDAGSKVRLGIYNDDGTGRPSTLVIDAGTIAGDSVAVQEIVISQTLGAGLYWIGGAVQIAPGTQPTVRTAGLGGTLASDEGVVIPAAGQAAVGWSVAAAGALPTPFGAVTLSGSPALRVFVKVA